MSENTILVNRAPVMTLWGVVVAERLGYDRPTALTLGKVLSGLNAQAKGRKLGIFGPSRAEGDGEPRKAGLGEDTWVSLCGRQLPAKQTEQGLRGVVKDEAVDPGKVEKYLASKLGDDLERVREAMAELAASFEPDELGEAGYRLYERFRPKIASGQKGWGQKGELDLDLLRSLRKP